MSEPALVSIVDDDESVRQAVESLLRSVGLRAVPFASEEDFLASHQLHGDHEARARALGAGAAAFLPKPFDTETLLTALEAV